MMEGRTQFLPGNNYYTKLEGRTQFLPGYSDYTK